MKEEIHIRIVVVGDSGTGKTSLIKRYSSNDFIEKSSKTVGANYTCLTHEQNKQILRLCIWDTSGQEKYYNLSRLYSRSCNALILVCDSSSEPLESLERWHKKLLQDDLKSSILFFIVISKIDLSPDLNISPIEEFGKKINAKVFITSAKDNKNIQALFSMLTQCFINYRSVSSIRQSIILTSFKHSLLIDKKKKKCCY